MAVLCASRGGGCGARVFRGVACGWVWRGSASGPGGESVGWWHWDATVARRRWWRSMGRGMEHGKPCGLIGNGRQWTARWPGPGSPRFAYCAPRGTHARNGGAGRRHRGAWASGRSCSEGAQPRGRSVYRPRPNGYALTPSDAILFGTINITPDAHVPNANRRSRAPMNQDVIITLCPSPATTPR